MALLISKDLTAIGGIQLSQLYIRFFISLDFDGKKLNANSEVYISRDAYLAEERSNVISIPGVPECIKVDYDRSAEGSDILTLVHSKFKEILSTDQIENIPLLDPSTGEMQFDPSTNELLTESVIRIPKFAMDTSISLIDIDASI